MTTCMRQERQLPGIGIRTLYIPYSCWGRTIYIPCGGRASSCVAALTREWPAVVGQLVHIWYNYFTRMDQKILRNTVHVPSKISIFCNPVSKTTNYSAFLSFFLRDMVKLQQVEDSWFYSVNQSKRISTNSAGNILSFKYIYSTTSKFWFLCFTANAVRCFFLLTLKKID